jgi:hypothetical protein
LRLESVSGILAATLNGQPLKLASGAPFRQEIALPSLAERNVLVLEIDRPELGGSPGGDEVEWGLIALVVRTADPATDLASVIPLEP